MIRSTPPPPAPSAPSSRGRNLLAVLVSCAAVGLLQFNLGPTRAGADPDDGRADARVAELTASAAVSPSLPPPPLPSEVDFDADPENLPPARPAGPADSDVISGRMALVLIVTLLENGANRFQKQSSYTATLLKQERIDGRLSEPQIIDLKLRHEPFSVYLKWNTGDKGRELLYVDGQNDGKMVVHPGGLRGRLLPAIKLDPNGSVALAEARYPVTRLGMLELARTIVEYRTRDLGLKQGVRCRVYDGHTFDGRDCYYTVIEYDDPQASELYRKSVVFIDKELLMPTCVKNFAWPHEETGLAGEALDEATLIEFYSYSDIRSELRLVDNDFDRENKRYGFKRR